MKRVAYCLVMAFTIMFFSCGDSSNEVIPPDGKEYIVFDKDINLAPTFDCDGGLVTISFSAGNNWTASLANVRADSWCTVSPNAGTAGKGSITIHVSANEEPDEKSAVVQLKSGTVTKNIQVTQKQRNTLLVTADSYEFADEGGTFDIEVKANVNYVYDINEDAAEWLSCTATRSLSTSYLTFKVAPNEEEESRIGIITITDGELVEEVTVYQGGTGPAIVISQSEYILSADGGNVSIEVSSNVDVEVEMPDEEWISENITRAYSTHVYNFTVNTNEGYDSRSAEIVFYNDENGLEEIVVIRQMQRDAIVLAMDVYEVEASACELEFEVEANVKFEVATEGDWITYEPATRGLATYELRFNIDENTDENEREGKIIITSGDICQEILVVQAAPNSTPSVSQMADYVIEVTDRIEPLFMQCETIEELEEYLEDIKKIRGVEDAYTTSNSLFVEIKGGFPISWIYTPKEVDGESDDAYNVYSSVPVEKGQTLTRLSYDEHDYSDAKKVCIINQQANDQSRDDKKVKYNKLANDFEDAGFSVEKVDGENANGNFFYNSLTSYDVIFLITHGSYDDKKDLHWICTGEECNKAKRDKIFNLINQWIGFTVDRDDVAKYFGFGFGIVDEQRGEESESIIYLMFNEVFLQEIKGTFNNSIIFNTSCQSLTGGYPLADVFINKGASVYLGYDETNCEGKEVGPDFYSKMLTGMTVGEAYNSIDRYDEYYNANLLLRTRDDEDICIVHPEPITCKATDLTPTTITLNGQIKNGRGDYLYGFCWGTDDNVDIENGQRIIFSNVKEKNKKDVYSFKHQIEYDASDSEKIYSRTFVIFADGTVAYGDVDVFSIPIKTYKNEDIIRDYLVSLYYDTNGAGWDNNENWCTDAPISEWEGVELYEVDDDDADNYPGVNAGDLMFSVDLEDNNLNGTVDLKNCPYIVKLYLSKNDYLKSIDVSNCINLWYNDIDEELRNLETLNISGTKVSIGIRDEESPNLKCIIADSLLGGNGIRVDSRMVSEISISINDSVIKESGDYGYNDLVEIELRNTSITELDIQNTVFLSTLQLVDNDMLNSLVINNVEYWGRLIVEDHDNLREVKISNCNELTDLFVTDNESLDVLHVVNCKDLKYLACYNNSLTELNVSGESLEELLCYNNKLPSLQVSGESLKELWCDNNEITSLQVSGGSLEELSCCNNRITSLIPEKFKNIHFSHDVLYEYKIFGVWELDAGLIEKDWIQLEQIEEDYFLYYRKNDYGWYYEGEPHRGYHEEGDLPF